MGDAMLTNKEERQPAAQTYSGIPNHGFMKIDLRISIKDYRRNKKTQLHTFRFATSRQFWLGMSG
jgi:hypothetical protein